MFNRVTYRSDSIGTIVQPTHTSKQWMCIKKRKRKTHCGEVDPEMPSKRPSSKMVAFEKKKHVIPRLTRNPESINGTGFPKGVLRTGSSFRRGGHSQLDITTATGGGFLLRTKPYYFRVLTLTSPPDVSARIMFPPPLIFPRNSSSDISPLTVIGSSHRTFPP